MPFPFITIVILSCGLILAAPHHPARAQENVIRIIGDDGAVSVFNIEDQPAPADTEEETRPVVIKKQPPVETKTNAAPHEKTEQAQEHAKPVDAAQEPAVPPPPALATTKTAEKPDDSAAQTPPENTQQAQDNKLPPVPLHKPPLPERLIAKEKTVPGTAISEKLATAIAIESAPPSNGFRVSRGMHNDRPVYIVMFKTGNGPHKVLVDAETGDILKN